MRWAIVIAVCWLPGPALAAPDTVVVCPQAFRTALGPWIKHRTEQGHEIALISNLNTPLEIRADIRKIAKGKALRFIVLVGDADPAMKDRRDIRARCVPAHHAKAKVNILWGSEPEIGTDNWYADLNDDVVPDVAIGRLTADTPAELSRIVEKILTYERSVNFGPWRRRIHFVAGMGGFGKVADAVLEMGARKLITDGVPAPFSTTMTYGSWRSPYCPDPRRFHQTTLDRLNDGSLFWVYIGHGHSRTLDRVRVPGGTHHILDTRDVAKLHCSNGSPIAIFLACYTGAFDAKRDCLAEEMLRRKGGPVAVVCGSRVTMPYGMAMMGTAMMDEFFVRRRETLGEVLLHAKRSMVRPQGFSTRRLMLDMLAKTISPKDVDLAEERKEHLHLFNLIGDPLLRLRHPEPIKVEVAGLAVAGGELRVSGRCALKGRCTLELVVRRDRLTFKPASRRTFDSDSEKLAAYQEVYRRANDHRLVHGEVPLVDGKFAKTIRIPETARGACHIRVFVEGADGYAVGAANVRIKQPPPPKQEPERQ
ncbi:MAG: hypothetical protein IIA67_04135 [Planctomycetes bacterium]|nr:hypothetical protein [Planctomycetota bacterium]